MPHYPSPDVRPLIVRARAALGLTQKELGEKFGSSHRTAARWESGQSHPTNEQIHALAHAVHSREPALAAALAAEGGTTLEALGLGVRPAPPSPPSPPLPPPRPFPPIALMLDSVVLAAVQAAETCSDSLRERGTVREVLRAAFGRARGLGLTLEEVDEALSPREPAAGAKPAPSPRRAS